MAAFLIGFLISAIAAVPAILLVFQKRNGSLKIRLKLWVAGLAIRFLIIGISLLLLFHWTDIARIPTISGVLVAYFTSYGLEVALVYRSNKPE